ncbi:MAG: hypothetical protein K6F82_01615 [Sphaerochaetaceae bacterium]|nr:hypothetical protein [Sphaerochaetaceae bacterium]
MKKYIFCIFAILILLVSCSSDVSSESSSSSSEIYLPISLEEFVDGTYRAITFSTSTYAWFDADGNPLTSSIGCTYQVPTSQFVKTLPAFAGLRSVSSNTDSMTLHTREIDCTVTESGNYYVVEGSNDNDVYMYAEIKKDGTEIKNYYEVFVGEYSGNSVTIVDYAPSITVDDGVYSGKIYAYQIQPASGIYTSSVAPCIIPFYRDSNSLVMCYINCVESNTVSDATSVYSDITTLSRDNLLYKVVSGAESNDTLNACKPASLTASYGSGIVGVFYTSSDNYVFEGFDVNMTALPSSFDSSSISIKISTNGTSLLDASTVLVGKLNAMLSGSLF